MKKFLLLASLFFITYSANSQILISLIFGDKLNSPNIEFGLDGGLTLASLPGLDNSKTRSAFNLGFYFDFRLKNNPSLFLNTGVMVKGPMGANDLPVYNLGNAGLDSSFAGGEVERKLNYFYVPFTLKYMFKSNFYAKAGIQLGLRNACTDVFTKTIVDKEDLVYKKDIKSMYHNLDGGLTFGIGYHLVKGQGMNIGITYYLGLIDARVEDSGANQFNRAFYFNVGIPIGKDKPAQTEKP